MSISVKKHTVWPRKGARWGRAAYPARASCSIGTLRPSFPECLRNCSEAKKTEVARKDSAAFAKGDVSNQPGSQRLSVPRRQAGRIAVDFSDIFSESSQQV